jgi:ornithine cyclodeaminase
MSPSSPPCPSAFDAQATARLLPWRELAEEIATLLRLPQAIQVPARIVMPLAHGGSLFCMPATDGSVAMTKLISLTPGNAGTPRPTIRGDVVVFDVATGERRLILDGPTVTARRTAAVSLLAAQRLAPRPRGPLLIIGAGVQGLAHLQAFAAGLELDEVHIASRSAHSAQALAEQARSLGLRAQVTDDAEAAARHCPLIVTCTPAQSVVLHAAPREDTFIAAVGAFTPSMAELSPDLCQGIAQAGSIVVDTEDAVHEAGDLLQAGLDVARLPTLAQVVDGRWQRPAGPVLFKCCGWGGWDLAATRLALRQSEAGAQHG